MIPNWSVQNEIQKRVQKEADEEWAKFSATPKVPQVKIEGIKYSAGVYNLLSGVLKELRP